MSFSLGQQLREARLRRGLSLPDVAHKTRIPVSRLQDLEADHYTSSGGLTYTKSFLRTYARFLDVDAGFILEKLTPPPLGGPQDYRYLIRNFGPWIRPRQPSDITAASSTSLQRGSYLTMAAIGCVIMLLGAALLLGGSRLGGTGQSSGSVTDAADDALFTPVTRSGPLGNPSWSGPETPASSSASAIPGIRPALSVELPPDTLLDSEGRILVPRKAIPVEEDNPAHRAASR